MKVFQLSSDVKPYPTVNLQLFRCNGQLFNLQLFRRDAAAKSNVNRKKCLFANAEDIDIAITYR